MHTAAEVQTISPSETACTASTGSQREVDRQGTLLSVRPAFVGFRQLGPIR